MPLDYFALPIFRQGLGLSGLGEHLSEMGGAIGEGQRRRRKEANDKEREDRILRHQMAMEANAANLASIAEKRQLASEAFTRGQTDLLNRRAGAQEQRDALTFEQQQADRRAKTVSETGGLLGAGRVLQAQARAKASQFADPRTGEMQGVNLEALPPPPEPGVMPMTPTPPEFVGPLEDPESARVRAIGRVHGYGAAAGTEPPQFDPAKADEAERAGNDAAAEVQRQQAARDQYGKDVAAYPAKQEAFTAAEKAHAEGVENPRYRETFPGGQSVDIDPREEKNAIAAEASARAARLRDAAAAPGQNPDVARMKMLEAQAIDAQLKGSEAAPITNTQQAVQAQGFKAGEAEKDRASREAMASAKLKAKGLGHRGQGEGTGVPSAGDQRVLTEMDKNLESITRKGGLREQLQHSQTSLDMLKADPRNPVNWVNAIDAAIRTNTGRAAIKAQFDLYMGHAHGTEDEFNAWLERFRSGLPSPEQQKNLLGAFNAANGSLRREAKEAYDNFRRYDQDPRVKKKSIGLGYQARERNTFGTMPGYAKPADGSPPGPPPEIRAKAQKALNDPNAPPAAKDAARKVLGL
jgi:hypothetical protein